MVNMTPWQLAKDSEHSQQVALFCFCARAQRVGFELAKNEIEWPNVNHVRLMDMKPIPELAFFHAIPNGGNRGDTARSRAIEGGRMKAEGVKAGVLDCFWPLTKHKPAGANMIQAGYSGLYIEMKSPKFKRAGDPQSGCTDEQRDFGQFVIDQGYSCHVCYSWLEAAEVLEWYYNL